ncbi:outer membrane beta-barrel protein [Rhodohalobacter sulfatireducens]|uniref:PorT family protein n=1 Tax=Rhodohalobacter sulfatireducens TaxID=2911366 RepID=A0ABS9KJ64_9BACT|nr:outer membrane beta-barrel protein [Rhodohalobacter sulfatireducens]MCG2590891.1 PorT family protein [Rhodohalobacter sulfatireducens]
MKKYILTFAILLCTSSFAFGQVEIKAFAGTNFATLSDTPSGSDVKAKAGYHLGGGVLIGDKFYVEPSVHIVRQSKELTIEGLEEDGIEFTQNFVKVPVMLGYHLLGHESGPLALRIFGGPAAYFAGSIKKGPDQINKDDIKNAQFMVDAGAGVDILFLFLEVNYEASFSNYFENFGDFDSKHRAFGITAGIHIDF